MAEKTKKKREELEQKALEECSFQPKTRYKEEDRRPFEDFLMQQAKHTKLREEKLKQQREEKEEQQLQVEASEV